MPEELGRIEKLSVDKFKKGRGLFFVPLIYYSPSPAADYIVIYSKYWNQVESQLAELELRLGNIKRVYHELIVTADENGIKAIKELSDRSHQIVKDKLDKGATFEATEEEELLTEFMDWSKCLMIGLQNQKVFSQIYESYTAAGKKRSEHITKQINETLKEDEIGVIFIREGHQLQFPADVEVFYVAPPALDEIKRWLRDQETKASQG